MLVLQIFVNLKMLFKVWKNCYTI